VICLQDPNTKLRVLVDGKMEEVTIGQIHQAVQEHEARNHRLGNGQQYNDAVYAVDSSMAMHRDGDRLRAFDRGFEVVGNKCVRRKNEQRQW
jgi:hypothetical protein